MKKITVSLLIILILVITAYAALFIFVNMKGKDILAERIEQYLGLKPEISSVSFLFPRQIRIRDFKCADISFSRADISLGFPKYSAPLLNFKSIYLYDFNFKIRHKEGKFIFPPFTAYKEETAEEKHTDSWFAFISPAFANFPRALKRIPPFAIKYFYLKNASAELVDLNKKKPLRFILKGINGKLKDFTYPKLAKFYIDLKASLEVGEIKMEDALYINGWVDYFNKNMDAEIILNNIDYSALKDYYPLSWKPDNLKIKEAVLALKSNLKSQNNELAIDNVLSLERIEFIETDDEESISKINFLKTILSLFKGKNDKPAVKFKLTTKMDSPKIDFSSFRESFSKTYRLTPAAVAGRAIGKVKREVLKIKKGVSKGVKGVKEVTVDNTVETIKGVVDAIKTIIKSSDNTTSQE